MIVPRKRLLQVVAGTDLNGNRHLALPAHKSDADLKRDILELHRAWLRELMRLTSLEASPLARQADLSDTSITRLFDEDYAGNLSPLSIYKLCRRYNVPSPDEFDRAGRRLTTGFVEAEPFDPARQPEVGAALKPLLDGREGVEPMILRTFALEGAHLAPGDVVMLDRTAQPEDGDAVCASIEDGRGNTEQVWRVFRGGVLLDENFDPKARSLPYVVGGRVRPVGVVRGMIRPASLPSA